MSRNLLQRLFYFTILLCLQIDILEGACVSEMPNQSKNYIQNGNFTQPAITQTYTNNPFDYWSAASYERGRGNLYNSNWGTNIWVIELDTTRNVNYSQIMNLNQSKYLLNLYYAARVGKPLSSSGMNLWWNGIMIYSVIATDFLVHRFSLIVQSIQGNNQIIIQGTGVQDQQGMSVGNATLYIIQNQNRQEVNGFCVCKKGYYDDLVNYKCLECEGESPFCLTCQIDTFAKFTCFSCQIGFYPVGGVCKACSTKIQGCQQCEQKLGLIKCSKCNSNQNYFLTSDFMCLEQKCFEMGIIPDKSYWKRQCSIKQDMSKLIDGLFSLSYIIMFFSLISIKIVGIQLFGVLQVAYFNLADNQFVHLYLSPLQKWKAINGYAFWFSSPSDSIMPERIRAIGYSCQFISNLNLMLLVLIIEFILAGMVCFLGKKFSIANKIGKFMIKEVFITLFMFMSLNISFSLSLHFQYSTQKPSQNFILSTVAGILGLCFYIVSLYLLEFTNKKQFGQFKNKFKSDCTNNKYISISIIYRFFLGSFMALSSGSFMGTLIILTLPLTYCMFTLINLPFKHSYQNYRAFLCHFTQIVILLTSNYYQSMKLTTPLQQKVKLNVPAIIQLSFLVLTVVISCVCLAYEIYLFIKKQIKKRKVRNFESSQKSQVPSQLAIHENQDYNFHTNSFEINSFEDNSFDGKSLKINSFDNKIQKRQQAGSSLY